VGSLAGVYALARGNSSASEGGDWAIVGVFFGAMMVLGAGVGAIYAAVEDVGARRAASSEAMDACLQPALRAWELGPEHPRVAWSLRDLAYRYYLQSDFADAERLYLGALAILEKTLGADAPEVATILDDYAALLRQTGRAAEAEGLERRAGVIRGRR
jgi:tetratricopeptide (TPR) repeat protein